MVENLENQNRKERMRYEWVRDTAFKQLSNRNRNPLHISTSMARDGEYVKRVRALEEELSLKDEVPLHMRTTISDNFEFLGDNAGLYGEGERAPEYYKMAVTVLEPFVANVRDHIYPDGFRLWRLYSKLGMFRTYKRSLMFCYREDRSFYHTTRAYYLSRLGLLSHMLDQNGLSKSYFFESANTLVEQANIMAHSDYYLDHVWMLSLALVLYIRSGDRAGKNRIWRYAINGLRYLYPKPEVVGYNHWDYAEALQRIYKDAGLDSKANKITDEIIEALEEHLEHLYIISKGAEGEKVRRISNATPRDHIRLGLAYKAKGEMDTSLSHFKSAADHYRELIKKDGENEYPSEDSSMWEDNERFCNSIRKKILLLIGGPGADDMEEQLRSYLRMAEVHWGFPKNDMAITIDEEIFEYSILLKKRFPKIFLRQSKEDRSDHWGINEGDFISALKNAREKKDRRRKVRDELDVLRDRLLKNGWSNGDVDELERIWKVRRIDVTLWPEDAFFGFKKAMDEGRDLSFTLTKDHTECALVYLFSSYARGVFSDFSVGQRFICPRRVSLDPL